MKETVWMGWDLAHSMEHSTSHQSNEWDWITNQRMNENCGTQVDITKGAWHLEGVESSPPWDTSYVLKPRKLLKMLSLQSPHLWNGNDYAYLLGPPRGSSEDIHEELWEMEVSCPDPSLGKDLLPSFGSKVSTRPSAAHSFGVCPRAKEMPPWDRALSAGPETIWVCWLRPSNSFPKQDTMTAHTHCSFPPGWLRSFQTLLLPKPASFPSWVPVSNEP